MLSTFHTIYTILTNAQHATKVKPEPVPVTVLQSSTPSVYICEPLDPDIDYTPFAKRSDYMFSLKRDYVSPIDINYELPSEGRPEFAFIGRSNVGKSSLVGSLLGNKNLVRVSKAPGCTRSVNYFKFMNKKNVAECYLIDLPGYGYARASRVDRQTWSNTLKSFLSNRCHTVLRRVYLLIDSRHPIKDSDIEMMDLLNDCGLSFQVILTKADVSTKTEKIICLQTTFQEMMSKRHACGFPIVHMISSHDGVGLDALKQSICEIVYDKD